MNSDLLRHLAERTPGIEVTRLGIERHIVPFPDSIKVLKMRTIDNVVEEGEWVRVRQGSYKGDVGLVVAVNFRGAEVLLVPRLKSRPTHSSGPNSTSSSKRKRTADVPQLVLFNPEDLDNNPRPGRLDNGHYTYMKHTFEHGLIRKRFDLHSISSTPTAMPSRMFFLFKLSEHPSIRASTIPRPQEWVFEEHDMVVICSSKKEGRITTIGAMYAEVELAHGEGAISVPLHELRKLFVVGDSVSITSGPLNGRSGLVVNVDDDIAYIFDNSSEGCAPHINGGDSIQVFIIRY